MEQRLDDLAIEHLLLRLRPLNRALRRAVERQRRAAARLARPEVAPLCITDDQVGILLDDADRLGRVAGRRGAVGRRPLDRPGLEFSYSGLKTHVLTTLRGCAGTDQDRADVACAFEIAVVETLVIKSQRALQDTGYDTLVVAGGVGANRRLREALTARLDARVQYPRVEFCTDNGAMIAYAGCLRLAAGQQDDLWIGGQSRKTVASRESNQQHGG